MRAAILVASLLAATACRSGEDGSKTMSEAVRPGAQAHPNAADALVGDVKLHYLEQGEGPLLLLLHGFPEYGGVWTPYLAALSDRFHVVAPDLRGYNLSSQPAEVDDYQLERLMLDVVGLVHELGYQKAYLVGHDWGGLLSWYLAAHHPETFERVTIINAPHPKVYSRLYQNDEGQRQQAAYVSLLVSDTAEQTMSANDFEWLRKGVFNTAAHKRSPEQEQGYLDAWSRGLRGPTNYYRAYFPRSAELAQNMPRIEIPILVLWGERDHALSIKNLEGLDEHIADLKIVRYPDGSHWINEEKAGELGEQIRKFCSRG